MGMKSIVFATEIRAYAVHLSVWFSVMLFKQPTAQSYLKQNILFLNICVGRWE